MTPKSESKIQRKIVPVTTAGRIHATSSSARMMPFPGKGLRKKSAIAYPMMNCSASEAKVKIAESLRPFQKPGLARTAS